MKSSLTVRVLSGRVLSGILTVAAICSVIDVASAEPVRATPSQTTAIAGRIAGILSQTSLICTGHAYSRIVNQIANSDEVYVDQALARVHLVRNDITAPGKKREAAEVQTDSTFTQVLSVKYRQEVLTTVYSGPINSPVAQISWVAPSTTECLPPSVIAARLMISQVAPKAWETTAREK